MANDFLEQILGQNQFLTDLCTASPFPRIRDFLTDLDANIDYIFADCQTYVAGQGPRGRRPSENAGAGKAPCTFSLEFEFDVDRRFLDLFVTQCYLVA